MITILQGWIGHYGFFGVLAACIIEEIISPIPSSLVQGFAGIILFSGVPLTFSNILNFLVTVPLASAIGVTLGSLPYVWLSRVVGLKIIDRYGKYIGVTHDDIHRLQKKMESASWDDVLFIGLRAFPLVPNVVLAIYSGITEVSYPRYIILSMIGVFIRGTIVGGIGWFAGNSLEGVSARFSGFENIGLITLIVVVVIWLIFRKKLKTT
jgi:membrane protein DedA with SNARE-associated domain